MWQALRPEALRDCGYLTETAIARVTEDMLKMKISLFCQGDAANLSKNLSDMANAVPDWAESHIKLDMAALGSCMVILLDDKSTPSKSVLNDTVINLESIRRHEHVISAYVNDWPAGTALLKDVDTVISGKVVGLRVQNEILAKLLLVSDTLRDVEQPVLDRMIEARDFMIYLAKILDEVGPHGMLYLAHADLDGHIVDFFATMKQGVLDLSGVFYDQITSFTTSPLEKKGWEVRTVPGDSETSTPVEGGFAVDVNTLDSLVSKFILLPASTPVLKDVVTERSQYQHVMYFISTPCDILANLCDVDAGEDMGGDASREAIQLLSEVTHGPHGSPAPWT